MKKIIIVIGILIYSINSFAQWKCDGSQRNEANNVLGFIPTYSRVTNGIAISPIMGLEYCSFMDSVRINGLYVNLSPISALASGMSIMMAPVMLLSSETYQKLELNSFPRVVKHKLNGVSVGVTEVSDDFCMQGLQLSAVFHSMAKLNGASVSLLMGHYDQFNGLMISGFYNQSYSSKGVQIGLINKSAKLKGVQIGLWNVNEKRSLPLINWQFKKS